jgi:succinyl-diaminopimelate desuccinylase
MELIELTKRLIEYPSVTGDLDACNNILDFIKSELSGFTCEQFEKNGVRSHLYYVGNKRPEKFRLILNAHVDVVPAVSEQFKPQVRDGKIFGRGAQDMKSGAAGLITAFAEMAQNVSFPLGLQIVTDEETGGFNGAKHQFDQGVLTDFILAGESTNLRINNYAKGIVWVRLKTRGVSAHGAYAWEGKNALDKMRVLLNDLRKRYPEPTREVWKTTLNIARIETSNTAQNKVPADAMALLDFRIIPKERKSFTDNLKAILADRAEYEFMADEPTQETASNHPDILLLRKVAKQLLGATPEYLKTHGGSDVRFYSNAGAGAICFGPTGAGLHTDNEWVDIKSMETFYMITKKLLTSIT